MRSSSADRMGKISHILHSHAQLSNQKNEEHLYQLICVNQQITTRELSMELKISFSVLELMVETL